MKREVRAVYCIGSILHNRHGVKDLSPRKHAFLFKLDNYMLLPSSLTPEIIDLAEHLLENRDASPESERPLMVWLNNYVPKTLAKYGLTPDGVSAVQQQEAQVPAQVPVQPPALASNQQLSEPREKATPQGATPLWHIPTKSNQRGYWAPDHIYYMLKNQNKKIDAALRWKKIKFKEDNLTIEEKDIPQEIAESAKRWDEATVLNWIAPLIPNTLRKAGLLP